MQKNKNDKNTSENKAEEAYLQIKTMMFQRKIKPSQRLLYKDLADMLKMSHIPIVNALNRLVEQGFLSFTPFKGYEARTLTGKDKNDLLETRKALESYVVEHLVKKATDQDLKTLIKPMLNHAEYQPIRYDNKRFSLDAEFHISMANITQNKLLIQTLRRIFEHFYLGYPPEVSNPARLKKAAEEHKQLLREIKKRNIANSIELIRLHINKGQEFLYSSLRLEEEEDFFFNIPSTI